mmetsp:Transcript_8035/g.22903  ORF Transcript_8035/g.22903 Transcript_8035/m.22903 type:complete len:265 (-) Transcript_8035:185-979(-)
MGSRKSHNLHVWSNDAVANKCGEQFAKRRMLMKFWCSPLNVFVLCPVTMSYSPTSTQKPLVMKKSSVQQTDKDERCGKRSSRTCSMQPGLDSSYRAMHVVPDCDAPTTAHCGCVCNHARPKIGYESTSKTCVWVSFSWSRTAITPSLRPVSKVPGRVGWNSNCRTPLLERRSRRACGTTSSMPASSAQTPDGLLLARPAERHLGGGISHASGATGGGQGRASGTARTPAWLKARSLVEQRFGDRTASRRNSTTVRCPTLAPQAG